MVSPTIQKEKTQKKERHRDETYKYGSVESSETSTDVSNQIFIMRTKHVKGHEHWVINWVIKLDHTCKGS